MFTVTVTDFAVLGDLVAALAEQEMATVAGPTWRLRPDSETYRRVRVAAARDALARATDYAGALSAQVTGVVEVADVGLLTPDAADHRMLPSPMPAAGLMSSAAGPASELSFNFQPVQQTVRAAIEARFMMTAPDLRQ